MKILVINCGSSSIKYKLYDMADNKELAAGLIERIGEAQSKTTHTCNGEKFERNDPIETYDKGIAQIIELLTTCGSPSPIKDASEINGVGHRVVHGGEDFAESVVVDDKVEAAIEACAEMAPLHNPANLAGLRATKAVLPGEPQVAVFDTAFFQTMPPAAFTYALPYEWYTERKIRRYGFHGTSHRYITQQAAQVLGKPNPSLITMHLGNGCSASCIKDGKAIDQTMGLTPLEGLVMGTRSGDFDPAIIFHMIREGMTVDEVRTAVEKKSGLLGISGVSRDMRDVEVAAADGNKQAALALNVFAHRAKKYIGSFLAELGNCDAIVFTGGVGENGSEMREMIVEGLEPLGIELDKEKNNVRAKQNTCVSKDGSKIAIWVIPTNEELMIAQDTMKLIS